MSYPEIINRLFQVNLHSGMKLGLQNCLQLQKILDNPDRSYKTIHVAGTNGKGSVTTKIASGLQAAGYRVGLYTSPHISCFRERIRINNAMISESDTEKILNDLFKITKQHQIPATFFELVTLLALIYFANEKVDFAVLETGLGGRLDATNIVEPILSIITSISLDHTEILGTTIEAITKEKAGIIKPKIPILIGPKVPFNTIKEIAILNQSPFYAIVKREECFEEENRAIAKKGMELLNLSADHIMKGLEGSQPCRFERLTRNCQIVLDVAHNPDGLTHLFKRIKINYGTIPIRILFGLSKNKDVEACLKIIKNHCSDYHLIEATNGRGHPVNDLENSLIQLGVSSQNIFKNSTIEKSLQQALEESEKNNQLLVICGSFFIMGSIRKELGFQEPRDEFDMNEKITFSRN